MDNLQHTFKESYALYLKDEVKANISIAKYSQKEFDFDKTKVKQIANLYEPKNLLEKLLATKNDYEAAVILYEAYKNLSPLLASTETFWVYLTHVDLFQYVQFRHPVEKAKNVQTHILDHWFFGKGHTRNTLAQLWWGVHESVDASNEEDPYHLTKIFFKNYSFRVIWLTVMLRTKQGLLGILDFLEANPDVTDTAFEHRGLFIAKYFNRMGGAKQLSLLPRSFFSKELEKVKDVILSILSREHVANMDASYIVDRSKL
jgi:hypothetical protein